MNLADLIADRKADRSYEALANACGGTPSAQRLQQIATMPLKAFPDANTVKGLAVGLGVSTRAIVLAAAESIGIDVATGSRLEERLPSGLDVLDRDQTDAALRVAALFLRDAQHVAELQAEVVRLADELSNARVVRAQSRPVRGTPPAEGSPQSTDEDADSSQP